MLSSAFYSSILDGKMMTSLLEVKVFFKAEAVEINIYKPGGLSY